MGDTLKNNVYKLNYISNKRVNENQIPEKIVVFYGNLNPYTKNEWGISEDDLMRQFNIFIKKSEGESEEEYSNIFEDLFSPLEIQNIKSYDIEISFSFERIYGDDTIETVKKKIINNIKIEKEFSFDEMYLFSKRGIRYTPLQLYNKLSNNDTVSVTKKALIDFLTNSHRRNLKEECELLLRTDRYKLKDVYTYDDIYDLFKRRVYDVSASTDVSVNVYLNDEKIPVKDFEKYADLIEKYASMNTSYDVVGIVLHNRGTGERAKIRNPVYEQVKNLRGNQPKLQYQYLSLRKEGRVSEFLKFYPENKSHFSTYRDQVHLFTETLFKNYISCYIKKEKPLILFSDQYRTHMFNLHQKYLNELREKKQIINSGVVQKYVNEMQPSLLMYCLNFQMRKRNVDTIVADSA